MKRKTGIAVLFSCLAFAGTAAAQEKPRPDPETAKILTSVGIPYDEAKRFAEGRDVFVYYDDFNAGGEAFASGGEKTCSVSWSWDGEGLSTGFLHKDAKAMRLKYDHAIDKDIEKITMLHELSHCTQKSGDPNNEYGADERALSHYLATGGSRDTAQYWVYWRSLSPLLYPNKYAKSDNYTPAMGPRLQAKFFGGETQDTTKIRAAYDEILAAVVKTGKPASPKLVHHMLADKKLTLSPEARQLLQFYDDGFRYLAGGPSKSAPVTRRMSF